MSDRGKWKRVLGMPRQPFSVLTAIAAAHMTSGEPLTCAQIVAGTKDSDDPITTPSSYTAPLARGRYIERAEPIPGQRTIRWRILDRGLRFLGLQVRKAAS